MDALLVFFIIFDIIILFLIYRFMANKLTRKLALVEERQRARWARDEEKVKGALAEQKKLDSGEEE